MARISLTKGRLGPPIGPVTGSVQASAPSSPTTMTMSVKEDTFTLHTPSTRTTTPMDVDMKLEPHTSPSQSPTSTEMSNGKTKLYPTPVPITATPNGTKSETPSPPPPLQVTLSSGSVKKTSGSTVQLIGNLPVARDEALKIFSEISENNYQYRTLGRCKELLESMTCDCTYEHGFDNPRNACSASSDCINRLTQVECLPDDCRCGLYCQNQRFQRKEYADIEIVLTEKKGYGLRAQRDLPKDTFIYEYVGDVVNTPSFKKRMREYGEEGIQHFYFMMLQKDEFIDATKSGGIGRFANHSCNPNCYVAKWTIGDHVRMGIFSKRDIRKYEEITFNYNVDRYGHQAQVCYCSESNCLGFIGGKTQTDIAAMDDLYLDALGITDEADILELKGTKKKKGKKIDDPDFMPSLKPIVEKDVPKVVQAIRQTQSRKVMSKLLTRIRMTEDQAALRQIMRLRGYSLMTNLLEEYANNRELVLLALQCMSTWPLLNRNKVEDSKVIVSVRSFVQLEENEDNAKLKSIAEQLISHWESLPLYNRIPKRVAQDGEGSPVILTVISTTNDNDRPSKKARYLEEEEGIFKAKLVSAQPPSVPPSWHTRVPQQPPQPPPDIVPYPAETFQHRRESIQAIIEQAAAAEAAAAEAAAATAAAEREKAEARAARKKAKLSKKTLTSEEKEVNKEKRLHKLVGAVVVKCMSKYAKGLDRELFKKYAKELTHVIADKEKKSSTFKEGKLDTLSEDKMTKIKKFAKEYIAKILRKVEKSKRDRPLSSSVSASVGSPSFSTDTPHSAEDADTSMVMEMSVEEAMDMESDSESDVEDHADHGEHDNHDGRVARESPLEQPVSPDVANEPMSAKDLTRATTDPRRRPVPY
ncbi:hypothetical protein AX15_005126 [Amanita polypyramis BW_CC]|nr:hypothetical protein AX15_005126 [Amanita polypyramis BW_CC]